MARRDREGEGSGRDGQSDDMSSHRRWVECGKNQEGYIGTEQAGGKKVPEGSAKEEGRELGDTRERL